MEGIKRKSLEIKQYRELLELVKEKGLANQEIIEAYTKWCEKEETLITKIINVKESRLRQIKFLIQQSKVYNLGGDVEEGNNIRDQIELIATAEGLSNDTVIEYLNSFSL